MAKSTTIGGQAQKMKLVASREDPGIGAGSAVTSL
jgi:hypothetical protein